MNKEYLLKMRAKSNKQSAEIYNYDLVPENFIATDKITIKCPEHGVFHQRAYTHVKGAGCVKCSRTSGNNRRLNTDKFVINSKEKFGDKFSYQKTVYIDKSTELIITCDVHGDMAITPDQHRWTKYGCKKCDYEIPRADKKRILLDKAKVVHGDKYDYSRVEFTNISNKVEIVCRTHGSFWQSLLNHVLNENNCPTCSQADDLLTFEEFLTKARIIHGERYMYRKEAYQNTASMITITCKEHGDFPQRAASHLAGCGCKACFVISNRLTTDQFIKNAQEIHNNRYDYSKAIYSGSKSKVEIICPKHGSFWQSPNSHVSHRAGCKGCIQSKGETAVESALIKHGLEYIQEYRIKPHPYRYDFYLPKRNVFIEFHGYQHYKPIDIFGGEAGYLDTVRRDEIKMQLAKDANVKLIVLTYLNLSTGSVEKELIRQLKLS